MSFNAAHRAYADAIMNVEAAKIFKKSAPSSRNAAAASYKASYADDQKLRPGSSSGWYKATANSVNRMIASETKKAVKAAYKKLKKEGKVTSIETLSGVATASLFGGIAAKPKHAIASTTMSRRGLLTGVGAMAGAAVVFGSTEAMADNYSYISAVKRGLQSYVTSKSPAVVRGVGAGIRG